MTLSKPAMTQPAIDFSFFQRMKAPQKEFIEKLTKLEQLITTLGNSHKSSPHKASKKVPTKS